MRSPQACRQRGLRGPVFPAYSALLPVLLPTHSPSPPPLPLRPCLSAPDWHAGAMAACAAPLVGLMAQRWFGFSGASTVTGEKERDLKNARALGSALLAFMTGE